MPAGSWIKAPGSQFKFVHKEIAQEQISSDFLLNCPWLLNPNFKPWFISPQNVKKLSVLQILLSKKKIKKIHPNLSALHPSSLPKPNLRSPTGTSTTTEMHIYFPLYFPSFYKWKQSHLPLHSPLTISLHCWPPQVTCGWVLVPSSHYYHVQIYASVWTFSMGIVLF